MRSVSVESRIDIEELHFLELHEVAKLLHSGQLSPVELTNAMIRRVEVQNPERHAFVRVLAESARESALLAEKEIAGGHIRSPLHGVPIAFKDMFWVRGVPTAAGMSIHQASVGDDDATAIARLRAGGAVLLGQLTMTQAAHAEHRPPYTAPTNPWSGKLWSGASSSGSGVAVASGLCFGALSSETGGSTKLPSAVNGITAMKPSWGRVSRHGVFELAGSLDHVGVMARSAADAAAILAVIAGTDAKDPTAARHSVPDYTASLNDGICGVKIGLDEAWTHSDVDAETTHALDESVAVLKAQGANIKSIKMPDSTAMIWDWFGVCAVEAALAHEATYPSRASEYGPALTELLNLGHSMSGMEHQRLLNRRTAFSRRLEDIFDQVDLLAMPVLAFPPPTLERMARIDDEIIRGLHRFTCPFNMSGNPGIVLPCGFTADRFPIVFQLVGRRFSEERLFTAGHEFQRSTAWHRVHPSD